MKRLSSKGRAPARSGVARPKHKEKAPPLYTHERPCEKPKRSFETCYAGSRGSASRSASLPARSWPHDAAPGSREARPLSARSWPHDAAPGSREARPLSARSWPQHGAAPGSHHHHRANQLPFESIQQTPRSNYRFGALDGLSRYECRDSAGLPSLADLEVTRSRTSPAGGDLRSASLDCRRC
jgi:hypothetical protein